MLTEDIDVGILVITNFISSLEELMHDYSMCNKETTCLCCKCDIVSHRHIACKWNFASNKIKHWDKNIEFSLNAEWTEHCAGFLFSFYSIKEKYFWLLEDMEENKFIIETCRLSLESMPCNKSNTSCIPLLTFLFVPKWLTLLIYSINMWTIVASLKCCDTA